MNVTIKNAQISEYKKIISMLNHFVQNNKGKIDLQDEKTNVKTILKNETGFEVGLKIKNGKISLKKV